MYTVSLDIHFQDYHIFQLIELFMISLTEFSDAPFRVLNRYMVYHTIWYLFCQIACAHFLKSYIEYLLFIFWVTCPDSLEVFIFTPHYATCLAKLRPTRKTGGLWIFFLEGKKRAHGDKGSHGGLNKRYSGKVVCYCRGSQR